MLENARRQFILVLITLVAALLCCAFLTPLWGPDLKGGNQLIYEVPEDVLQRLEAQHIQAHEVMTHTVLVVGQRIDPTGVNGATVSERGHNGILIELPWADKDTLDQIKERVSSLGKLEMRVAADELYQGSDDDAGVHFDLQKEKQQLQKWLDAGGRDAVRKDWKAIDTFNDDAVNGPLA